MNTTDHRDPEHDPRSYLQLGVRKAIKAWQRSDPDKAQFCIGLATQQPMSDANRQKINKALEFAQDDEFEKAIAILKTMEFKNPPPAPKPRKFRPKHRGQTDGGPRVHSNAELANNAACMLDLVHDRDALADDEALVDALTNLRHWADRQHVDFDHAVESSATHHEAEQ